MSGKNEEDLKMQLGEALDPYKQIITGNSDRGSGGQRADRNADTQG